MAHFDDMVETMEGAEVRLAAVVLEIKRLQYDLGQLARTKKPKQRVVETAQDKFGYLGLAGSEALLELTAENHMLLNELSKVTRKAKLLGVRMGDGTANAAAAADAGGAAGGGPADTLRPQFGTRFLNTADNVLEHNAWDNVEPTAQQIDEARLAVAEQKQFPVAAEVARDVCDNAANYWDVFYNDHKNKFYKDRHWLLTEFPELILPPPQGPVVHGNAAHQEAGERRAAQGTRPVADRGGRWAASAHASRRVLELGCGAGNTVFPLLDANKDPGFFVYACDFAPSAVEVVRAAPEYDPSRCHAFVCDIANEEFGVPDDSLDIIIAIFVLSALHPAKLASIRRQRISSVHASFCLRRGHDRPA